MRRTIIIVAAIILPIFFGSGMIGIAVSGDQPEGTPFNAIWDAIDNIGDSHWSVCGGSICTEGGVGIGTNIPGKKLKVLGDAMFVNHLDVNDDTYFFIEDQQTGVKSVGAYSSTTWKALWIDGSDILLNYQSGGNVGIGTENPNSSLQVVGYVQLDLTDGSPPPGDCAGTDDYGRMKVDSDTHLIWICVCVDSANNTPGWISK